MWSSVAGGGVNVSYSIWGNIRAGSWHLRTLKNHSNDTQLSPHCNFQVTRCETSELGCFLRNTAKCSATKHPSISSISRQTERQDRSTLLGYFCQSDWFGALLFQIYPWVVLYYGIINQNHIKFSAFKGGCATVGIGANKARFRRNSKWISDIKEKWENLIMFLI